MDFIFVTYALLVHTNGWRGVLFFIHTFLFFEFSKIEITQIIQSEIIFTV